jgi:Uma2 family endonuclease
MVYADNMAEASFVAGAQVAYDTHWTYADYKAWELKPRERYEIINGEAYAMAAPNAFPQSILTELLKQIANFLTDKPCKVYPAPYDVRLFYKEDETDNTVVQPDISVICDKKKRGFEGCHGAPDFVVEILSPSNTAIEMRRKFNIYREAGVREYWVLDGEDKTLTVYLFEGKLPVASGPTADVDQLITRSYGEKDKVPVTVLNGLSIELEPVFAE